MLIETDTPCLIISPGPKRSSENSSFTGPLKSPALLSFTEYTEALRLLPKYNLFSR